MPRRTDQSEGENGRGAIPPGLFALHPLRPWIGAILALPMKDGVGIATIEKAADRIFWCWLNSKELDLPKSKPSRSQRAAKAEAQRFYKLSYALWQHMRSMHLDARHAIGTAMLAPGLLPMLSGLTIDEYERATAGLAMGAFQALRDSLEVNESGHRPSKASAGEVAYCCALEFEKLTGRRPTIVVDIDTGKAGGPFLAFLQRVFEACELSASPEAMGRAAIAKLKEQHGPVIVRIDPAAMEKTPPKSAK